MLVAAFLCCCQKQKNEFPIHAHKTDQTFDEKDGVEIQTRKNEK